MPVPRYSYIKLLHKLRSSLVWGKINIILFPRNFYYEYPISNEKENIKLVVDMLFTFILQLHIISLIHIVINVYSRRCLFNWFINISSFPFIFYDFSYKRLTTRTLRILSNYGSNYLFNL